MDIHRVINVGFILGVAGCAQQLEDASSGIAPTSVFIRATSSSTNNTLSAEQVLTGSSGENPVVALTAGDWSSRLATMTLNYDGTYAAVLDNNSGKLEIEMYGYIEATGATSYEWDTGAFAEVQDTYNAVSTIAAVGTASTSQDATSSGIGEKVRIQHNSGGRGYLLLSPNQTPPDAVEWKIFADATNASGTTSAPSLKITLESQ